MLRQTESPFVNVAATFWIFQGLFSTSFCELYCTLSTAIYNELTLVTNNTKHFENVPNLKIENWKK